jgi:hypothetical protein
MITCRTMSPTARLGNQIFHIGILYSVHKKHGYEIIQPNKGEQFWKCFDTNIKTTQPRINSMYNEQCIMNETDHVFRQPDFTGFNGWFQSHLYYKDCRQDYINFLKFKNEHSDIGNQKIEEIKRKYNLPIVSVHYRRTDYLQSRVEHIHGNLSKYGYYEAAFNMIQEPVVYLIFSDDIQWCRDNVKLKNAEYIDMDEYKSLYIMSKCDKNIIANSTFSWWGAFLNPNATVYAPDKWNGPLSHQGTGNNNCSSIDYKIPRDWIKVQTTHNTR